MNETISDLQLILEDLLQLTDASRTTLRIDIPEQNSSIDAPLIEVLAPGIRSIKSLAKLEQRKLPTVIYIIKSWLVLSRRIIHQVPAIGAKMILPHSMMQKIMS